MHTSLETTEGVLTNGGDCGMRRAREPQRHLMPAAIITTMITTALLRAGRRQEPSANSEKHGRDMFWGNWRILATQATLCFLAFFCRVSQSAAFRGCLYSPPLPSGPCRSQVRERLSRGRLSARVSRGQGEKEPGKGQKAKAHLRPPTLGCSNHPTKGWGGGGGGGGGG